MHPSALSFDLLSYLQDRLAGKNFLVIDEPLPSHYALLIYKEE
jgi:hypothetical protein